MNVEPIGESVLAKIIIEEDKRTSSNFVINKSNSSVVKAKVMAVSVDDVSVIKIDDVIYFDINAGICLKDEYYVVDTNHILARELEVING